MDFLNLCILSIVALLVYKFAKQSYSYHFKFLIYYAAVISTAAIIIPLMVFRPGNLNNFVFASSFCQHVSYFLGIKWIIRGREHLEKERACIIVANHQTSLDILGIIKIWPIMGKCTVLANKQMIFGHLLSTWLSGLIFIDREKSEEAKAIMNNAIVNLKKNKIKLWVFPEGGIHTNGEICPFKKGAFHVAINAHLPILPVVYSSYYHFMSKAEKRFSSGHVIVTTLAPISTEGLTTKDVPDLMEKTRLSMSEVFKSTNQESLSFSMKKAFL